MGATGASRSPIALADVPARRNSDAGTASIVAGLAETDAEQCAVPDLMPFRFAFAFFPFRNSIMGR